MIRALKFALLCLAHLRAIAVSLGCVALAVAAVGVEPLVIRDAPIDWTIIIVALIGAFGSIAVGTLNLFATRALKHNVNSRLDELVASKEREARSAGHMEGRAQEQADQALIAAGKIEGQQISAQRVAQKDPP